MSKIVMIERQMIVQIIDFGKPAGFSVVIHTKGGSNCVR